MQKTLVSTKLYLPNPRQPVVLRPALTEMMDRARTHALTLVSAPPGYGKTTLVSGCLAGTHLPFAWLSLDEADNDPVRFLEYFLTVLNQVVPTVRIELLGLLQEPQAISLEALAALLINEAATSDDFFLALDDFHLLSAQPVVDFFAYLLEHLPPSWHMLFLSRTDPPLPLARLRARGKLLEIRADQLRFTSEEIARFFRCVLGMELPGSDVKAIETRTEGWIAGLQLVGLAMQSAVQGGKNYHDFLSTFTGSHAYIMDFLTEEVLEHQPDSVRTFLLQTSILDRMSGPLCEAVVEQEEDGPGNCQMILEFLEQSHLFIVPLDYERRWYRYHPLFKEALSRRLEGQLPEQIPRLHHRASEWYERHGYILEAIHHAQKSGSLARTARLVEQHGCDLIMRGEVTTLAEWLSAVEPYTRVRPWLAMQKVWMLLLTGQIERAGPAIDAGEQILSRVEADDERNTLWGSFAAARAHLANMLGQTGLAAEQAQHALALLADNSDFSCSLRSVATSLLGDASSRQGEMEEARVAYTDAVHIGRIANDPHMEMISSTSLGNVLFEQGQLHQAVEAYSEALQLADRVDGSDSAYAADIHFGLSNVYYAWNWLDQASISIEQASRLSNRWGYKNLQAACQVLTAQVERAKGNIEGAQGAMASAREVLNQFLASPIRSIDIETALARLSLARGDIEGALLLVHKVGIWPNTLPVETLSLSSLELEDPVPYQLEPVYILLVRLLITLQKPEAALALCERLLPRARAGARGRTLTELHILQALAFQMQKDIAGALAALEEAITLARPEQFMRVFLDEGEPMAKLLYQSKAHHLGGDFVDRLLSQLEQPTGIVQTTDKPFQKILVEPLSARELEVLQSIAEGNSNQEIAGRLFISEKTVKRHISNIYAKLEAKSRTQAVSLARVLKLLD